MVRQGFKTGGLSLTTLIAGCSLLIACSKTAETPPAAGVQPPPTMSAPPVVNLANVVQVSSFALPASAPAGASQALIDQLGRLVWRPNAEPTSSADQPEAPASSADGPSARLRERVSNDDAKRLKAALDAIRVKGQVSEGTNLAQEIEHPAAKAFALKYIEAVYVDPTKAPLALAALEDVAALLHPSWRTRVVALLLAMRLDPMMAAPVVTSVLDTAAASGKALVGARSHAHPLDHTPFTFFPSWSLADGRKEGTLTVDTAPVRQHLIGIVTDAWSTMTEEEASAGKPAGIEAKGEFESTAEFEARRTAASEMARRKLDQLLSERQGRLRYAIQQSMLKRAPWRIDGLKYDADKEEFTGKILTSSESLSFPFRASVPRDVAPSLKDQFLRAGVRPYWSAKLGQTLKLARLQIWGEDLIAWGDVDWDTQLTLDDSSIAVYKSERDTIEAAARAEAAKREEAERREQAKKDEAERREQAKAEAAEREAMAKQREQARLAPQPVRDRPQQIVHALRSRSVGGHVCEQVLDNMERIADSPQPENIRMMSIERMYVLLDRARCI